jgi:hypothetical protein
MYFNTTGANNTAMGPQALYQNTTGSYNTAIGSNALQANTTASANTAIGYQAGYTNTTGGSFVALGWKAGYTYNTSAENYGSTFLGLQAGYAATGHDNTFVGGSAGVLMTSGSANTILGTFSGNQNGLDIRTSSNYIVLSDGAGNIGAYWDTSRNMHLPTSGSGIIFNNSSALTNSTLNDYETGTWTPVVIGAGTAGTYTPTNVTAWYTKIGNLVTVSASFGFSAASGGTGYMKINGLPFSYIAGSATQGAAWTNYFNFSGSPITIVATSYTGAIGSGIELLEVYNNAAEGDAPISGVSTSTSINFTITYKATF